MLNAVLHNWLPNQFQYDDALADTNLTFYYGFHLDPYFLIGSLYPTEIMVPWRVDKIKAGLTRLGMLPVVLEFLRIHSDCDAKHGLEWQELIISPLFSKLLIRDSMAEGLVLRLATSEKYLSDRLFRAKHDQYVLESHCEVVRA
jgi:hypothetical protein